MSDDEWTIDVVRATYDHWADGYDDDVESWGYRLPDEVAATLLATWSEPPDQLPPPDQLRSIRCESSTKSDAVGGGIAERAAERAVVLDAGCGTGRSGVALSAIGCRHVVGVDASVTSLSSARATNAYRALAQVDLALPLPFADSAVDAVVCVGVFDYLPDVRPVMAELLRATRPGGVVVVTQRDDLWPDSNIDEAIETALDAGALVWVSEGLPYLPGHEEFGDDIAVHQVTIDLPA